VLSVTEDEKDAAQTLHELVDFGLGFTLSPLELHRHIWVA
jgi:hypothetical protein